MHLSSRFVTYLITLFSEPYSFVSQPRNPEYVQLGRHGYLLELYKLDI